MLVKANHLSVVINQVVEDGRKAQCRFAVLGLAGVLTQPIWGNDFVVAPLEHYSKPLPKEARRQLQVVKESAGDRFLQAILIEEAPRALAAPKKEIKKPKIELPEIKGPEVDWQQVREVGKTVLAAGAVAAVALGSIAVLAASLALSAAAIDPILIAIVLDENYNVVALEVCRWDTLGA